MEHNVLVLGVGNYLMGDEGVGVHAVQKLLNTSLVDHVDIVDGGTGGFHLLEYFSKYPIIILIDAELNDNESGSVRLIKPKFASDFPKALSTHDIGLRDMMTSTQLLGNLPEIYLFAVGIQFLQMQGVELTDELEAKMPALIHQVTELAMSLAARSQTAAT